MLRKCLMHHLIFDQSSQRSISVFATSAALGVFLSIGSTFGQAAESSPRERLSFNSGWRFVKGDPAGIESSLGYSTLKPWLLALSRPRLPGLPRPEGNPGGDVSFVQPSFDDSQWRQINLPHDWGIEGPFKQEYPGETGKLPWWGVGWYRKHFHLSADDKGKQISLELDGAMAYAAVWLNGHFVGGWPYGYASWSVDLTPFLKTDQENVLAIRLDNPPDSSRWYPGGGVYRSVWLLKTAPVHVGQWGAFVTTPEISDSAAKFDLRVTVDNDSSLNVSAQVGAAIFEADAEGHPTGGVLTSLTPVTLSLAASTNGVAALTGQITKPKRWTLEHTWRYVAVTTVRSNSALVDRYELPFGIRTIQFTADNGFLLNGVRLPMNGVCDHHDLGALGSACNVHALQRQIELLKEMGCNAIRTSHNPPAPELLELCDQLGMVVMDEAFDCWVRGKKKNDYHVLFPDWHERDLRALVRRDRNHPSVVLWSIGNEVAEQGSPEGHEVAAKLAAIVRSEDTTRPVTAGCNDRRAGFNGFQKQVEVFGYNYKPTEYGKVREANPQLPLFGSETASCVSSRGEYFFPVSDDKAQGRADFQVSSYDLYAPPWATTPTQNSAGRMNSRMSPASLSGPVLIISANQLRTTATPATC